MSGDKKQPTYLLRLSREHAAAVSEALEVFHRAKMGQWRIVMEHFEGDRDEWQRQREQGLTQVTDALQRILCPDLGPNSGYGYAGGGHNSSLVYEVKTALNYRRAWTERPPDPDHPLGMDRDHWEPILFPTQTMPKPNCSTEDGSQPELAATGQRIAREVEKELGTTDIKVALATIKALKAENKALREFAEGIRDGYDCDSDSHKYQNGNGCRCCDAEKLLTTNQKETAP
jgi:hypothetical protein